MNPGGMRADLVFHDGGAVTYADAHRVQPFETSLWVLPATGAQLVTALQRQFTGVNADSPVRARNASMAPHASPSSPPREYQVRWSGSGSRCQADQRRPASGWARFRRPRCAVRPRRRRAWRRGGGRPASGPARTWRGPGEGRHAGG
ncbi:5'-nucleotidase C-terminal domain-containing protein [Streptomyces sp. TLI_105]|uniref:5'-nucleotidase C-terminal domain-containing protein n=1 Tax=Streptomyces sp. TLI_105 TaxID=1881019 RepID=UPI003523DE9A